MINIIKLSTSAVGDKLNRKDRQYSYVVLGYDFMVDINFKVWLIEVNKNTGLVFSSPIIKMLLPRMIDDSFRLTIDEIFSDGNTENSNYVSPFPVDNYTNTENLW